MSVNFRGQVTALTDFGLRPERFKELADVWVTKFPQNFDLPGERGTAVVCGCIDRAIIVPVRNVRSSKLVRPNHFHRDELASTSGEGLVHGSKGASTELMADVVISPETITSRTGGRKSEHETYLPSRRLVCMPRAAPCSLTIVFETVSVRLRLKGSKSDFASIAQDSALSVTDLIPIDLRQPHIRNTHNITQDSTYEGSICRYILDHDRRGWIVPVPSDDTMLVT